MVGGACMEKDKIEEIITMMIADGEAIKVMLDDMPDTLPVKDQYRIHAIYTVAEDLVAKARSLSEIE